MLKLHIPGRPDTCRFLRRHLHTSCNLDTFSAPADKNIPVSWLIVVRALHRMAPFPASRFDPDQVAGVDAIMKPSRRKSLN